MHPVLQALIQAMMSSKQAQGAGDPQQGPQDLSATTQVAPPGPPPGPKIGTISAIDLGMNKPPLPGNPDNDRNIIDRLSLLLSGSDRYTNRGPKGPANNPERGDLPPRSSDFPYAGSYAPGGTPKN